MRTLIFEIAIWIGALLIIWFDYDAGGIVSQNLPYVMAFMGPLIWAYRFFRFGTMTPLGKGDD